MGNTTSTRKVNFEDVQYCIKHPQKYLLINTLETQNQGCLIQNTVTISKEEQIVNNYLKNKINVGIIVYDKNANAPNLMKKYDQLVGLGFINVFIYQEDYLNGYFYKIYMEKSYFLQQVMN